jgi:uncharacterized protein YcbX
VTDEVHVGIVADLWRYPVKSFGGESTRRAFLGPFGPIGDRRHAVVTREGEPLSARRQSKLLGYRAYYADAEAVEEVRVETPEGRVMSLDDPDLESELDRLLDRPVTFKRSPQGFPDAAHVHLVTVQSVGALGAGIGEELDRRRFRPNVVVELECDEPFAETQWPGQVLHLGDRVELRVVVQTERCAVTTSDPDTLERDKRVHEAIARTRENFFGVYAQVQKPGWVEIGDPIALVRG